MTTLEDTMIETEPVRVRLGPEVTFVFMFPFVIIALAMLTSAIVAPGVGDTVLFLVLTFVFLSPALHFGWAYRLEVTERYLRRNKPFWLGRPETLPLALMTGVFLRNQAWGRTRVVQRLSFESQGKVVRIVWRQRVTRQLVWPEPEILNLIVELERRGVFVDPIVWDYFAPRS